jgi:pimeloyl-ACP methyl ester carboxylesterase
MKKLLTVLMLLASMQHLPAQTLARRSFLGIQMENVTDDVKRLMAIKESHGVLISGIIPGSTAESAGFKKGDVLLSLNSKPVKDVQEAIAIVAAQKSSSEFTYELIREKKKIEGRSIFKAYPEERYPDIDVEYATVKTATGLQRMIISKQRGATKKPAVVFIGGIGCYSLDSPLDTARAEIQLLNRIVRSGFLAARVEKPGIGDGAGSSKKCSEISFAEEKDVYVQAVNDLKQRNDVDPSSIYIIGHSMGGVMAPMVAAESDIRGIVAYGTIGSNFIEYLLKTRRTIGEAYGWSLDETDAYIKLACECASYYFIERLTTEEAARKKSDCADHLGVFDLRSRKYNDELYAINFPALWKPYKGRALLIWGKSDFVAAREDHEILTNTINSVHPGNATLAFIDRADHGMSYANDFAFALNNPGQYNPAVGDRIVAWLKDN